MADRAAGRELETLSNILALVLEDRPGEAAAALEAVRRKARRDGITGGTLEQVVRRVADQLQNEPRPAPVRRTEGAVRRTGARGEAEAHLQTALRDNALLRSRLEAAERTLARHAERRTMAGLERHLRHADGVELALQRRTLDLRAVHEELDKQRRQAERRAAAQRRARRRARLALLLAILALVLAGDRPEPVPSHAAGAPPARTLPTPAPVPALPPVLAL